jgi:hypothetical protein
MVEASTLAKACSEALSRFPGRPSEQQKELVREDVRLQLEHPGRYVAFIDSWKVVGDTRRLVREVIAASDSMVDVSLAVADVPNAQLRKVTDPKLRTVQIH